MSSMMRSSAVAERQPHLFGARPQQYRQGANVTNGDDPPSWCPEMAHDSEYPYTLEEWWRDVRKWAWATKIPKERQGPRLSLAVGGAARTLTDEIPEEILANGGAADFGDGKG